MTENNWIALAPCALPVPTDDAEEPRLIDFYSSNPEEKVRAKAMCAECPFKLMCLQKALDDKERFGIHGGADEHELRRVQAINAFGEPHTAAGKPIRCPNCGPFSTKYLNAVDRKRTRTQVECTNCGLSWSARKGVNAKQNNW